MKKQMLYMISFLTFFFITIPYHGLAGVGDYGYILGWGSLGKANGQFYQPEGIAIDAAGYVYVADTGNNRIQKFKADGTYVTQWGSFGSLPDHTTTPPSRFSRPVGIAVDVNGYVYVADCDNSRIQKFKADGTYVTQWGTQGTGNGQFGVAPGIGPYGVAVDNRSNKVYVVDDTNNRIEVFDRVGGYLTTWGSLGSGNQQFNRPKGIAIDVNTDVYVADPGNRRIQKFKSDGTPVSIWSSVPSPVGKTPSFISPYGVAVDAIGNVFVTDVINNRVIKFGSTYGNVITQWGSSGNAKGQFSSPYGIAVSKTNGYVYVLDSRNNRIQVFRSLPAPARPSGVGIKN